MKKIYTVPAVLVSEADVQSMMAVSIMDGSANPNGEVLTKENSDWNVWGDED